MMLDLRLFEIIYLLRLSPLRNGTEAAHAGLLHRTGPG